MDSSVVLGIAPGATLVKLEFVKLAATTEVAATTIPDTLVKSITLAIALNSPEIVPEFTSKLGSTLDVVEGFDTVPGAMAVVPTVAMTLCVMGVEIVPDALGILPTVALTLKVVGVEIVPDVLGVLPIVALTLEVVGADCNSSDWVFGFWSCEEARYHRSEKAQSGFSSGIGFCWRCCRK